jgi:hypothetical protein
MLADVGTKTVFPHFLYFLNARRVHMVRSSHDNWPYVPTLVLAESRTGVGPPISCIPVCHNAECGHVPTYFLEPRAEIGRSIRCPTRADGPVSNGTGADASSARIGARDMRSPQPRPRAADGRGRPSLHRPSSGVHGFLLFGPCKFHFGDFAS